MPGGLSKQSVNGLYLITLVLLLILGSGLQMWSPHWGLILTEVLLIFLPAWLALRLAKRPVAASVRLGWPGLAVVGLSILVGLGLAPVAAWGADKTSELFGYTIWVTPDFFPTNLTQAAVFLVAIAVAAPLCEEFLFRGVIQRAYESNRPWVTILWVGLLFTAFHLSLQRFFLIIPVALALSYSAWRARSLWASIGLHFGYNLVAGILSVIGSLAPGYDLEAFVSFQAMVAGLILASGAGWAFHKLTADRVSRRVEGLVSSLLEPQGTATPPKPSWRHHPLVTYWAIIAAVPIIAFTMLVEVVFGRYPELVAQAAPSFQAIPWDSPEQWTYELRAEVDLPAGQADCQLSPEQDRYRLSCQVEVQAFTINRAGSKVQSPGYQEEFTVYWDRQDFHLLQGDIIRESANLGFHLSLEAVQSGLEISSGDQTLILPAETLLAPEWAWRGMALNYAIGQVSNASLVVPPGPAVQPERTIPPSEATTLTVRGGEPLGVPAGDYITWKVDLGEQSAWYEASPPHTLVQYQDETFTWVLVDAGGSGE